MGTLPSGFSPRTVDETLIGICWGVRWGLRLGHTAAPVQPDHPRSGKRQRHQRGRQRSAVRASERSDGRCGYTRVGTEIHPQSLAASRGHSRARPIHGSSRSGQQQHLEQLRPVLVAIGRTQDELDGQELHTALSGVSVRARDVRRGSVSHHAAVLWRDDSWPR
jgi:hypothetical protein